MSELAQLTEQVVDLYSELHRVQAAKYRPGGWWLDELEQLERFEAELWEGIVNCEDEIQALAATEAE